MIAQDTHALPLATEIQTLQTGTEKERRELIAFLAQEGVEEFRRLQARALELADFATYAAAHYQAQRTLRRKVNQHKQTWRYFHRTQEAASLAVDRLVGVAQLQGLDVPEVATLCAHRAALNAQVDAAREAWREERERLFRIGAIADLGFGPAVRAISRALLADEANREAQASAA